MSPRKVMTEQERELKNFSLRFQKFLHDNNLSQREVARQMGVWHTSLNKVVRGRNGMRLEELRTLANCYPELDLNWLITGREKVPEDFGADPKLYAAMRAVKRALEGGDR